MVAEKQEAKSRADAERSAASMGGAGVAGDQLTELRRLLMGPELDELRQRLDDPATRAREVSEVIADALRLREHPDKRLISALSGPFEEAFKASVHKNPETLVDAISPVMGPAIRKAISDALQRMMQSFQQTLDYALSPKSFKWRLEAWRTGKSFAEVVMLHTMLYRVEQIFLIHRQTGLVLHSVQARGEKTRDPAMMSSMITAIQDFVRDTMGAGDRDALDYLHIGDTNVWLEQGEHAVLAAVIRGNAPAELREQFRETLDQIHVEMAKALASFNGDPAKFTACQLLLEDCLVEQRRSHADDPTTKPVKKAPRLPMSPLRKAMIATGLLAIVTSVAMWNHHRTSLATAIQAQEAADRNRWTGFLDHLRAEPGIVVISAEGRDGVYHLYGLRDELAADPSMIAQRDGITNLIAHWEPYQALLPTFVLQRAARALNPPPTATLRLDHTTLTVSGSAPRKWIADARKIATVVAGVTAFRETDLTLTD